MSTDRLRALTAILDAEQDETTCGLCCQPATGLASINGIRYCHEGPTPTCYQVVMWRSHDEWIDDPSVPPEEPVMCDCGAPVSEHGGEMDDCPAPEGQPEGSERCGARHPVNETAVPCVEEAGHAGMHVSSTGCAGSRIEWACEHCGAIMHTSDRCALRPRPAAPAPVPDTCPDCGHSPHGSIGFCPNMASDNECSCTSIYTTVPVPDDEAVEALAALLDSLAIKRETETIGQYDRRRARAILAKLVELGWVSPEAHAAAVREAVQALGERIAEAFEAELIHPGKHGLSVMDARENQVIAHYASLARDLTREAVQS